MPLKRPRAGAALALVLALALPLTPLAAKRHAADQSDPVKAGATRETAIPVHSVAEEYQLMRKMGLTPNRQSLVMGDDGKPYDVIDCVDATGAARQLWFDISSFFGKGF